MQPPAEPATSGGKNKKKAVIAPEIPKEPLLHVLLHDTVIFPEGGGQPTDTGKIRTIANGVTWEVVQAKRHGGHAVHYVRLPAGTDVDAALIAFQPGAQVTVSLDQEDWDRRYDHVRLSMSFGGSYLEFIYRQFADVHAYLAASTFCITRNTSQSPYPFVVIDELSQSMLCGGASRNDSRRNSVDPI